MQPRFVPLILVLLCLPATAQATLFTSTFGSDYWDQTNASRTYVNVYEIPYDITLEDIDISWGSTQLSFANRQVT